MQGRLRYLARIVRSKPRALVSLLFSRPKNKQLAWTKLIVNDMLTLRSRVSICSWLPDPRHDSHSWVSYMTGEPRKWSMAVATLYFVEASCDAEMHEPSDLAPPVTSFCCAECCAAFPTSKALQSHRRTKHKIRAPQRYYAFPNGVCPVCKTCFNTRLRLLAHLSDSRRDKCWKQICEHPSLFAGLNKDQVDEFDAADRTARRQSRQLGHTHVLASGPAIACTGKVVGRVRR
eukprot:256807-Karenia_brevis.AAC.1